MTPGPLVSAEALRAELSSAGRSSATGGHGPPTLLDVRWRLGGPSGREEFEAGHLPGAVYVDLEDDLAAPPGVGGRHPLPDPEQLGAALRVAGVRRTHPVVVYDDWSGMAAARCWWLLTHHGHPSVRVLDGGLAAWRDAGGALAEGEEHTAPGDFVAAAPVRRVVDADTVPDVGVLLDVRAPERFRGESEPIDPVAGHVPGAVNLPTTGVLREDGRFREAAALRERFAEVGAAPGADVAAYCGSGITACHTVLALEVAGVEAALYPGSWSGWITDPSRPVERG